MGDTHQHIAQREYVRRFMNVTVRVGARTWNSMGYSSSASGLLVGGTSSGAGGSGAVANRRSRMWRGILSTSTLCADTILVNVPWKLLELQHLLG
ncbi:hypothetical protein E2C01_096699 [Portunus trituberculatus]|uniref:Uncharacterized protein n=1 Tax=Portunus trituberculatus TaxID=210409 RepID=A0A5B7JWA4_PORTR|nr:hypothetical protein [Portunus trituberculatus]